MPTEYLSVAEMVALAPDLFKQGAYTPSEPFLKQDSSALVAAFAISSTDSASHT